MDKVHPLSTPIVICSLDVKNDIFQPRNDNEKLYLNAIDLLMYLTNNTRPNIAFVVSMLARFSSYPT